MDATLTCGMSFQPFSRKHLGSQVKTWRADFHLSQHELAQLIGVTPGFTAHIETGRTMLGVKTCTRLAHALGIDEVKMLKLAGIVSHGDGDGRKTDEELLDPELRVFFREVWPRMSRCERVVMKDLLEMTQRRVNTRTAADRQMMEY